MKEETRFGEFVVVDKTEFTGTARITVTTRTERWSQRYSPVMRKSENGVE